MTEFRYLGSTVQADGDSEIEVVKRIAAGWNSWRKVSGVLCDRKVPLSVKGKLHKVVVRPAMMYSTETGGDAEDGEEVGSCRNENAEI